MNRSDSKSPSLNPDRIGTPAARAKRAASGGEGRTAIDVYNDNSPMGQAIKMMSTSVDDMRSSLKCAQANGTLQAHVPAMLLARNIAEDRGAKTAKIILDSFLKSAFRNPKSAIGGQR